MSTSSLIRPSYIIRATIFEKEFWLENFPKTEYFPTKRMNEWMNSWLNEYLFLLSERDTSMNEKKHNLSQRHSQNRAIMNFSIQINLSLPPSFVGGANRAFRPIRAQYRSEINKNYFPLIGVNIPFQSPFLKRSLYYPPLTSSVPLKFYLNKTH